MSKNYAGFMKRALLTMLAGVFSSAAMPLDIYQGPLVAERSLDPNVLYIHDDSGSMTERHMPNEAPNGGNLRMANFLNRQYYNPDVAYRPPLKYDNGKLVTWGNIDRRCKWPIVLNNGFSGSPTTCNPVSSSEAGAERDEIKREANQLFNDSLEEFFNTTVPQARETYDATCMTSQWGGTGSHVNWQRAINGTATGVIQGGAISSPNTVQTAAVAATYGTYRTDTHTDQPHCWALQNGDISAEEWTEARTLYYATINALGSAHADAYVQADTDYTIATTNGGLITLNASTAVYYDYVPGFNSRLDNKAGYTWDPIVMVDGKMTVGGHVLGAGYTSADWAGAPENADSSGGDTGPGNYEKYAFRPVPTGNNALFREGGANRVSRNASTNAERVRYRACPVLFRDVPESRAYYNAPVVNPAPNSADASFQGNPHAHCRYSYRTGDVDYPSNYQYYDWTDRYSGNTVGWLGYRRSWCNRTVATTNANFTGTNVTRSCVMGRHIIGDTAGTAAWTNGSGATSSLLDKTKPVSHYDPNADTATMRAQAKEAADQAYDNGLANHLAVTIPAARAEYDAACLNANWPGTATVARRLWQTNLVSTGTGRVIDGGLARTSTSFALRMTDTHATQTNCWAASTAGAPTASRLNTAQFNALRDAYYAVVSSLGKAHNDAYAFANSLTASIDQSLEHRVSTFVGDDGELITEGVPRRRTAAEEIRNFANWFSYYRTRTLAAKSGITLAFSKMVNPNNTTEPAPEMRGKTIRLGYDTINRMERDGPGQRNGAIPRIGRGVASFLDFPDDAKKPDGSPHPYRGKKFVNDFYDWIALLPASGTTPLKTSLNRVGQYYTNADEPWKEYPKINNADTGSGDKFGCRRAFTILMTDGYYTDGAQSPAHGDVDANTGAGAPAPVIWRTNINNEPLNNPDNLNDPRYLKNRYQYTKQAPFFGENSGVGNGNNPVSGSLADIAMYYWNRDLRSDMPNMVTPTKKDPAFWQHMQTFTIGLGVQGRMSDTEVNNFLATGTSKNILWTFPSDLDTPYERVDDLMHAGLNGHGGTAAAEEASEFAGKLAALLSEISGQAGSATSPATPRDMKTDSMFYEASYDPSDWVGDVLGYETCLKGEDTCGKKFAQKIDPAKWSASELLSQQVLTSDHSARNIVTSTGLGAVAFTATELESFKDDIDVNLNHSFGEPVWEKCIIAGGDARCTLHRGKPDQTEYSFDHLINYLRGDSSLEDTTSASTTVGYNGFRRRSYTDTNGKRQLRLLGDIVNSNPLLITARSDDWEISPKLGYSTDPAAPMDPDSAAAKYKDRLANSRNADGTVNREETILVGAGDGMLHGFDAKTGQEQFAYIPSAVHPILKKLADPQYSISPIDSLAHSFYVDGATIGADVWDGSKWLTVAVGSTGRSDDDRNDGGQSYFALDVEEASKFNTSSVLWEFRDSHNLGVPANGKATIALLPDGKFHALFGNGYGSASKESGLFVEELFGSGSDFIRTGVVSVGENYGLSSPAFITDRDGVAILAYAGDLEGYLWKFDLEKKTATALLRATDKDGNPQPITAAPRIVTGSNFVQVIVGTGIFLEQKDVDNTQVQTIYSVRDSCGIATGCTPSLAGRDGTSGIGGVLRSIDYETEDKSVSSSYTDGSGDTGVIQGWRAMPFDPPLDYTLHQGFLLDLDRQDMKGLRVVEKSTEKLKNHILVPAIVPSSDPCGSAVAPAFVELDPVNGAPKQSEILKTLEGLNIFRFSDGADAFSTTTTGGLPGFGMSDGTLGGDLTPTPCKEVSIVKTSGDYVSLLSCSTKKGRQSWRQLR